MSSLVASWSELELARELSRGLCGEPEAPAPPVGEEYVQFRAARFWAGDLVDQPRTSQAEPARIDIHPDGFGDWDALLAWCLRVAEANTVFVMDWQGFLIETAGNWLYEDVEAAGTQLMVTLEQADRMELGGRRARHVSACFETFCITGVRVPPTKRDSITLGVIAPTQLSPDVIRALGEQADVSLPRL